MQQNIYTPGRGSWRPPSSQRGCNGSKHTGAEAGAAERGVPVIGMTAGPPVDRWRMRAGNLALATLDAAVRMDRAEFLPVLKAVRGLAACWERR